MEHWLTCKILSALLGLVPDPRYPPPPAVAMRHCCCRLQDIVLYFCVRIYLVIVLYKYKYLREPLHMESQPLERGN
jgi:hypothetical protein